MEDSKIEIDLSDMTSRTIKGSGWKLELVNDNKEIGNFWEVWIVTANTKLAVYKSEKLELVSRTVEELVNLFRNIEAVTLEKLIDQAVDPFIEQLQHERKVSLVTSKRQNDETCIRNRNRVDRER